MTLAATGRPGVLRAKPARVFSFVLLIGSATTGLAMWMVNRGDYTHVIVISVDTLRPDHLGCYGYGKGTSPNIDQLAAAGVVFEAAFVPNTNTAPSHATVFTGLHTFSHGLVRNRYRLAPGVKTMAQHLAAAGWRGGAFVSSFSLDREQTGLDRGFLHYDDKTTRGAERPAKQTLRAAVAWLKGEAHNRAPVFLFFHLFDPHFPYDAPEEYLRRFPRPGGKRVRLVPPQAIRAHGRPEQFAEFVRRYDAEIAYADDVVGELIEALVRHGYWDESLVIFLSDHGETLADRSWQFDHGARVFEEQLRVPLMVRLPGGEFGGRRVAAPVHLVDILPTVLAFLGLPVSPHLHGHPLQPLFCGQAPDQAQRPIFSTARPVPERVPEIRAPLTTRGQILSLRVWPDKLIAYPSAAGYHYQLFDLATDPGETADLAGEELLRVEGLANRLHAWHRQVGGDEVGPLPFLAPEDEARLEALGYQRGN